MNKEYAAIALGVVIAISLFVALPNQTYGFGKSITFNGVNVGAAQLAESILSEPVEPLEEIGVFKGTLLCSPEIGGYVNEKDCR